MSDDWFQERYLQKIAERNFQKRGRARQAPKHNQLIVGPLRWSYQLLRPTIGERFMDKSEARIFIDRSFINLIALQAQTICSASCYH